MSNPFMKAHELESSRSESAPPPGPNVKGRASKFTAATGLFLLSAAPASACCGGSMAFAQPMNPMMQAALVMQAQQQSMLQAQLAQQMALAAAARSSANPPAMSVMPVNQSNLRTPQRFKKPEPRVEKSTVVSHPHTAPVFVERENHPEIAARLGDDLAYAPSEQFDKLLGRLRDGKGAVYTEALAKNIRKLEGEARCKARDALTERLSRMNAATLREKLQDSNFEVCRAAALACGMKEERSLIPDLIALMEKDPDSPIVPAARAALKSMTGQDFGPALRVSAAQRVQAVTDWKEWWQREGAQ